MNITTYIFGNLNNGYIQYPNDSTKEIFKTSIENATEKSQLIVFRSGVYIYYTYVRKLDNAGGVLGLSVMFNSVMLTDLDGIFRIFEEIIANMTLKGKVIGFSRDGRIIPNTSDFTNNLDEIKRVDLILQNDFAGMDMTAKPLPPVNYETNSDRISRFALSDDKRKILSETTLSGYTCIYKGKNFSTLSLDGYSKVLNKLNKEIEDKNKHCIDLSKKLKSAERAQRNTTWVAILGGIVLLFGFILWNKVLFPNEVTNYNAGEYMYYGPMSNGKPNGVGVAIYKEDDADGRKYYIGKFVNGNRQDDQAMLFYQDGDYFYGAMDGDKLERGILYMNSDSSHFEGDFYDNKPYNGDWYDHERLYGLSNGNEIK